MLMEHLEPCELGFFQKEGKGDTDWAFDLVNSLSKIEASVILKVLVEESCGLYASFW